MEATVINTEIKVLQQTAILGKEITVYGTLENPFFLAKDVAEWIEYAKTSKGSYDVSRMISTVDEDEKLIRTLFVSGQNRKTWFLTEDGIYEVLMQSRKPIAKQFKKAVKKILKEIRTKGGYIATSQNDTPEMIMARALQVAQQTIDSHEQQVKLLEGRNETLLLENEQSKKEIKELKPDAEYTQKVLNAPNTFTTTSIAKELNFRSAQALNKELRTRGIIFKNSDGIWVLYSKYAGKNYTKTRSKPIWNEKHQQYFDTVITVWTEKGRQFLNSLFKEQVA